MRRGNRAKLSVTVDPGVVRSLEVYAKRTKVSKSRIVEDAIRLWERSQQATLAREGYAKTAGEDLADSEAYLPVLGELEEA